MNRCLPGRCRACDVAACGVRYLSTKAREGGSAGDLWKPPAVFGRYSRWIPRKHAICKGMHTPGDATETGATRPPT